MIGLSLGTLIHIDIIGGNSQKWNFSRLAKNNFLNFVRFNPSLRLPFWCNEGKRTVFNNSFNDSRLHSVTIVTS
ncbi:hypothetical protein LCGC14_2736530 [marine sediment metagenome]|uniref:Uncharacterized protein n=1 Tax=marine sediment metagenome TaxID=412755 RepID=A0A0F8Z5N5_9ZZZZ